MRPSLSAPMLSSPAAFRSAVRDLAKRADAYAKRERRTRGGASMVIFSDTRTLDLLLGGHEKITVERLIVGAERLAKLETKPSAPPSRRAAAGSRAKRKTNAVKNNHR